MKIGGALTLAGFSFVIALTASMLGGTKIVAAQPETGLGQFKDALQTEKRETMPHNISNLLTRNLQDVFGENDPARRRAAIDQIYTEDVVFYEQPSRKIYRGRDEINRRAGALRAQHPDFRYQPIGEPEEVGDGGRIQWVEGRSGEAPGVAGTDFIIVRDGRIAAIYFFFDKRP